MAKTPFLMGNDGLADGKHRRGGKIYRLEDATAVLLQGLGKGRPPTDDELQRLGVEEEPAAEPGTHVRDFGAPAPAKAKTTPLKSAGAADQAS